MAKKARRSSGATFNRVLGSIPAEAEFEIGMVADSTTEVWTDIDTNIDTGEAWVIYGAEWTLENIAPTDPLGLAFTAMAAHMQIHRSDDSEILLAHNDNDLMFQDVMWLENVITAAGSTGSLVNWPRRFGKRTITMQPTLRALFRTSADWVAASATTIQIAGKLFYDKIAAPNIGQSKMGMIANL